jgi:hypothetical protein
MMGDFAGNAGLMSLWFDEEVWDWRFEFVNCSLGTQHIWWITHVLDLITLGVGIVYGGLIVYQKIPVIEKPKVHVGKGKAKEGSTKPKMNGHSEAGDVVKMNGKLDVPGAGNKSLRKKKSKRNLNGGNPSPSPSTIGSVVA